MGSALRTGPGEISPSDTSADEWLGAAQATWAAMRTNDIQVKTWRPSCWSDAAPMPPTRRFRRCSACAGVEAGVEAHPDSAPARPDDGANQRRSVR
jgi:hypothetical protein